MPSVVRMPEVLANASEAVIQVWLVSVGQTISVGDPLAEVETEKAVVELAAEVEGILARLIAEPGTAIGVGEPIAVVLAPGETDADIDPNLLADATTRDPESASPVLEAAPAPGLELEAETQPDPGVPSTASHSTNDRRLFATPLVRKLARERGIDLETVLGTGPGGRIVRRDLDKLQAEQPTPVAVPTARPSTPKPHRTDSAGFTDIPLTGMRKAIARRLTESKSTVPHFYLKADCRVDALVNLRRSVNDAATVKVSLNDFILKAVAGALIEVPEANTTWSDDTLRRLDGADVAVAIAVEGGLLTPVLRGVDGMSL
jgi:pyruvate dehydrogenase E2 component (dihydrolipoamide acetyltransferase)